MGDVTRLRQVLVNLLSNGIKFTTAGRSGGPGQGSTAAAPAGAGAPDGADPWQLHFSVRDTGIGIPASRLARLFKSFSQADASTTRQYGGTGLGLAISKRLVELMGGKMWVESVPQKGSTFHFALPFQPAPRPAQHFAAGPQPQLADLRLLIVDDNPTNRRILTLQTSQVGHDSARGQQRRRRRWNGCSQGETFDLAILDMQMPDMDGLMLATEIRKLPGAHDAAAGAADLHGRPRRQPGVCQRRFRQLPDQADQARAIARSSRCASFPAPSPPPRKAAPAKLDPTLASRLPLRVLLCDDNVINQKVALRLLQQMGYKADVATNGLEGLQALGTPALRHDFHGRADAGNGRPGSHPPHPRTPEKPRPSPVISNPPSPSSP